MSSDIENHLRFLEYFRDTFPTETVSVKRIPEGFAVTVVSASSTYTENFGPTIITDKDARRRCVQKLEAGINGDVQKTVWVSISDDTVTVEFTPKISSITDLEKGTHADVFVGSHSDSGWIQFRSSDETSGAIVSETPNGRRRIRMSKSSYGLENMTKTRKTEVDFRISAHNTFSVNLSDMLKNI